MRLGNGVRTGLVVGETASEWGGQGWGSGVQEKPGARKRRPRSARASEWGSRLGVDSERGQAENRRLIKPGTGDTASEKWVGTGATAFVPGPGQDTWQGRAGGRGRTESIREPEHGESLLNGASGDRETASERGLGQTDNIRTVPVAEGGVGVGLRSGGKTPGAGERCPFGAQGWETASERVRSRGMASERGHGQGTRCSKRAPVGAKRRPCGAPGRETASEASPREGTVSKQSPRTAKKAPRRVVGQGDGVRKGA